MTISRSDQSLVSLSINGTDFGTWDHLTGGDKDSDDLKYHPGGMAPEKSLGGRSTVNNVTLERLYDEATHDAIGVILDSVGKAECVCTKQPLDEDRNPYGKPLVYTGRLKRCGPPEHDSDGTPAASKLQVEISSATVTQAP
jgi:hypothetical protein